MSSKAGGQVLYNLNLEFYSTVNEETFSTLCTLYISILSTIALFIISDETLKLFPERSVSDVRNYIRMKLNNAEKVQKRKIVF